MQKVRTCVQLSREGKEYYTEAIFENGSRADIVVLDDFRIIEIAMTESEASLAEKERKYPPEFTIEVIRCSKSGDLPP
jgi:hypothetical protein